MHFASRESHFYTKLFLALFLIVALLICLPRNALAADWTEQTIAGSTRFDSVASSNTGQYLLAADNDGDVYLSTDYGATWTTALSEPGSGWTDVAISDSGQYMAASQDNEGIWVSEDYGATWDETFSDAQPWSGVAMTADGQDVAAVQSGGDYAIYHSETFGQINSWTQGVGNGIQPWTGISYAPDGDLLMLVSQNNQTFTASTDHGANWSGVSNGPNVGGYYGIALADDDIAVLAGANAITLSTNGGTAWNSTSATTPTRWNTVAVSHDGQTILAGGIDGKLSLSTDGGTTWEEQDTPGGDQWNSVSVSGDGTHLTAVGQSGAWTRDLSASDAPQTDTAPVAGNGPIFQGNASDLYGYIAPRPQIRYPDGTIVYLDATSSAPAVEQPSTQQPASPIAVRDLQYGDEGDDVRALQTLLIAQGYEIPAGATGEFYGQTRSALAAYQSDHGIAPASGYFGSITRAQMKSAGLAGLWW
jgi:hypothetical protein